VTDILDVPQIQPFQFGSAASGVDSSVNLFRGDVNFNIPLVSLTGRNGLDVQVIALYRSAVSENVKTRNLSAPTSILGLGWHLPTDRIEVQTSGSGDEDNKYFFVRNEVRSRLFRNSRLWLRGTMSISLVSDLDRGDFYSAVFAALLSQGMRIDASSVIAVVTAGSSWTIWDPVNEFQLRLQIATDKPLIQIYDGGNSYEMQGYDFSRIRYYRSFERWEITYSNGITSVFGGDVIATNGVKTSRQQAIQWGVRTGNWEGPGIVTHSSADPRIRIQSQYAQAWYFASSRTIWNDRVTFEYDQVTQTVGRDGLPYTKAIYLRRIVDVFGRTVLFNYGEKVYDASSPDSLREYADPNKATPNNDPDAFQSHYETRYLDGIQVSNEHGNVLYALKFSYALQRYTLAPPPHSYVYGDTFKRTLVAISKKLGSGHSYPDFLLAYVPSTATNPGALSSITYPEGCTVTYTYSAQELVHCSRDLRIDNPVAGSTPRVWFGPDYLAVIWYSPGRLQFALYTWIGRWQKWVPQVSVINDYVDLKMLTCQVQSEHILLYYWNAAGDTLVARAFHKDPRILGAWLEYNNNPIIIRSTDCQLAGGENFFAIADRIASTVKTYTWDALAGEWNAAPLAGYTPPVRPNTTTLFVSGVNNVLMFLSYDKEGSPGHKNNVMSLYYLNEQGQWIIGDTRNAQEISIDQSATNTNFNWSPLPWAMVATFVTSSSSASLNYSLAVYKWAAAGDGAYRFSANVVIPLSVNTSSPSRTVTIPYIADVSRQGLIASGPNLLRYNGEDWLPNNNLVIQQPVTDETIFWFTLGNDVVLKTENSPSRIIGMVQVFDPNTQTVQWREHAISLFDSSPTGDRLTEYFPTAGEDFLTWNTNVYKRGTSTDWTAPLRQPDFQIPLGTDTSTLINRGPDFMVYLVKSADGKTVLGTEVLTMTNGLVNSFAQINERYFSLVDKDGRFVSDVDGRVPGGAGTFVTYLPLDKDFDEATSIRLFRYVGDSIQKPIASFPATTVTIDDGFQTNATNYDFDVNSSACDYSGAVAKYYQTTVSKGDGKSNGYSVYMFFNSLNGRSPDENLTTSSFLDGTLQLKTVYDASDRLVSSAKTDLEIITNITTTPGGSANAPIYGAIVQVKQSVSMQDGVTSTTTYEYDPTTGSVCKHIVSGYNGSGLHEVHRKTSLFGCEVYPALWHLNNLGAIVQSKETVGTSAQPETVTSCSVTTYNNSAVTVAGSKSLLVPAPFQTYVWLGGAGSADFQFGLWTTGVGYSNQWFKTSSVSLRSASGLILQRQAPIGKTHSDLYSRDESVVVASFGNAGVEEQEAYYYGFEEYESAGAWVISSESPIVDTISWSGVRCLSVPPGKTGSPLVLAPANQRRPYLFSVRAKSAAGQDPSGSGWKISVYDGASLLNEQTLAVPPSGEWEFCFHTVDFTQFSRASLSVKLTPFNDGVANVFFDDVGFSPFQNSLRATVYDPIYYRSTEELGPYNAILRRRYDSIGRIVGQTGHANELHRTLAPFLSRQVDGSFRTGEPNSLANFQPMGANFIDRFYNDGVFASNWSSPDAAAWSSLQGYLIHRGAARGDIQLSNPLLAGNYVAHVTLTPDGTVGTSVGVTVGSDLVVAWSPTTSRWTLQDRKNSVSLNCPFVSTQPGEDWVLTLGRETVLFFVDGRLAFSYLPTAMVSGKFGIFASGSARFTNFFIGQDPQTGVKYFDGSGKELQGQFLEGKAVAVTQRLYYEGLAAVTTMPANLDPGATPLLAYRADAVTGIDWTTGVMTGAIADKLSDAQGYPYSRKLFEKSPLSRVVEIGAPGKDFAIVGGSNSKTVKYFYTFNTVADSDLPANQYRKTIRVDQNGNVRTVFSDTFGSEVLSITADGSGTGIRTATILVYSGAGRTRTQRLPNYFKPPMGSVAANWVRQSCINMRGQLVSVTDSDSGATCFIYDRDGLVRFSQNPEQAVRGTILYKKYDTESRIVEEGSFSHAWDVDYLQRQADDAPAWPGSSESAQPRNRYYYNRDGTKLNDLGNLTCTEVMNAANPSQVSIRIDQQFDDRQRLSSTTVTLIEDQISFVTGYEYDNIGNVSAVAYPSGNKLAYTRDDSGRVTAIRDASQNVLVEATYTAGDQVLTETNRMVAATPLTTMYSYNPQGWLTKAESPLLSEVINYTTDGYGAAGYFDGSVASRTISLSLPAESKLPAELAYRYKYDPAHRVLVAECTWGAEVIPEWSLGLSAPVTYDDNGNFLKVDAESYVYEPGTDFAKNNRGAADADFTKDKNGATISAIPRGIISIHNDAYSGRPDTIQTAANGTLTLLYDAKFNRLSKKVNRTARYYGRNLSGTVLTEKYVENGATQSTDFLYGPTGLFGMKTTEGMNAVLKDHLKSPRVVVGRNGQALGSYHYLPFGALIKPDDTNIALLKYLFGGYEFDEETGLYWAGARLYDPILRRFYSTDPKQQYPSPYLFVGNNPINMVDPNGEASWWAMLIGFVVGTIATIATGGAAAFALGTEVATFAVVGGVAGVTGAVAGDATTAGISGEAFTGTRALVDVLSGFAGGFVGAGVGGAAGRGVMNAAFNAGRNAVEDIAYVTRLGTATSMITGGISGAVASSAVTSAVTGQPFFSKETLLNVAISALAAAGGALVGSGAHFGWFGKTMPVELGPNDFNRIAPRLDVGDNGERLYTFVPPEQYETTRQAIIEKYGDVNAVFRLGEDVNSPRADVIAVHGVGRFVFPLTDAGYMRPMWGGLFAKYMMQLDPYFGPNPNTHGPVLPLKSSICFSALPGRLGSIGQTFASAMGRTNHAGRGLVLPSNLAQNWVVFNP
jgi:large repetitive protein